MRPSGAAFHRGGRGTWPRLPRRGWAPWMWSLTLGCMVGSAWSSSLAGGSGVSDSAAAAAGPPGATASLSHSEHHFHGARHHSAPISIYRSPASLRGGHGESLRLPSLPLPPSRSPTLPGFGAQRRREEKV
ncbi:hypothetical protein SKAU_G00335270 [Synaphobranchus kaupii]|uniref:Uncharacterized protein n=1 Tax=Synaphobranchus kaupii TaxID=118154 RepID=A0A9Q1IIV8_SYNKA|nr:hypothetical protein SKAU_G00335270 [Synaphobranchus kaupii]